MSKNRREGMKGGQEPGHVRPMSESERVLGQIERGEIRPRQDGT